MTKRLLCGCEPHGHKCLVSEGGCGRCAEHCICDAGLDHVLNRERNYRLIVEKVESQIPPELIAAMGLCGWNAFGMFETVLQELKKAKLPICCPHCIVGCNACGSKKWML